MGKSKQKAKRVDKSNIRTSSLAVKTLLKLNFFFLTLPATFIVMVLALSVYRYV
jgi:hypothetical protein